MKYYLIAGEASGDLHASRLMFALKEQDPEAEFRFIGGDLMATAGGTMVKHYSELAYMGFIPVLLHLPTILNKMRKEESGKRKEDSPSSFTLHPSPQIFYYISPKIWAWKEYRIKNIKRDVDELFSILPFEVDFFEKKHHYPIHYVGNPTADEVKEFLEERGRWKEEGGKKPQTSNLKSQTSNLKPIIALLAGSRRQEIKDNLPTMIRAAKKYEDKYELVLAGAPSIDDAYYEKFLEDTNVRLVKNQTYQLLSEAHAALVTSGTATLETALFGVPQVVCYETPLPQLIGWLRKKILKVKYISLVNLVADREVVRELVADSFSQANIEHELEKILDGPARQQMLDGYQDVWQRLGKEKAPVNAARIMVSLLRPSV